MKLPLLLSCGIIVAGAFASGALFFFLNLAHTKSTSKNTGDLHGSAGWATKEDIETTPILRSKPGVYVGGWYEKATKHLHQQQQSHEEWVAGLSKRQYLTRGQWWHGYGRRVKEAGEVFG